MQHGSSCGADDIAGKSIQGQGAERATEDPDHGPGRRKPVAGSCCGTARGAIERRDLGAQRIAHHFGAG